MRAQSWTQRKSIQQIFVCWMVYCACVLLASTADAATGLKTAKSSSAFLKLEDKPKVKGKAPVLKAKPVQLPNKTVAKIASTEKNKITPSNRDRKAVHSGLSLVVRKNAVKKGLFLGPLPDAEIISLSKQAVIKHERWGIEGLKKVSERCYAHEVNKDRCLYFDLASRKIDLMVAQAFNLPLNTYFDDLAFGGRLVNVYAGTGRNVEQANEFLRTASPQVNNYVVQKVKLSSFIK